MVLSRCLPNESVSHSTTCYCSSGLLCSCQQLTARHVVTTYFSLYLMSVADHQSPGSWLTRLLGSWFQIPFWYGALVVLTRVFACFYSDPANECHDNTLKQATTALPNFSTVSYSVQLHRLYNRMKREGYHDWWVRGTFGRKPRSVRCSRGRSEQATTQRNLSHFRLFRTVDLNWVHPDEHSQQLKKTMLFQKVLRQSNQKYTIFPTA